MKANTKFIFCWVIITQLLLIPDSKSIERNSIDTIAPISYSDGCHLARSEFLPKTCLYGDLSSKKLIYLIGDSHAAQWLPGFIDFGVKQGWQVRSMTKSGCPAAFLPMYKECVLWNNELIKEVVKNKPEMVFISNLTNDMHPLVKNSKNYYSFYRSGFSKMIELLGQSSQVSVIEDTPFPGFDVVNCLKDASSDACNFSNQPLSLTLLSRVITRKYQLQWISTNSDFCDQGRCFASLQGVNMYRDHSHISSFASKKFANYFLIKALNKK